MVAVSDLVPNDSQILTLIAIGIIMIEVPFLWFKPSVSWVIHPFKVQPLRLACLTCTAVATIGTCWPLKLISEAA